MPLNLLLFLQTCVESGGPATCLTTAYSQQPCCGDLVCVNSTCKPSVNVSHLSSHLSLNRQGRWGTTHDFTTSFFHFSRFSTALWDLANSRHVHSLMLSSNLFFCLPCLLPPFTVPWKMVLAGPDERETCLYYHSVCLFTMSRRSLCGPIACWILARSASLVTWSLYEMRCILL